MSEIPRKTGKWLRDDVPHTGWTCISVDDGGGLCEMCEVTRVVYTHRMVHERYPSFLDCGCVCAGFMAEDPATERLREVLYKWQRKQLADRTPIEKLRRKGWRGSSWRKHDHVCGWTNGGRFWDPWNFCVEISNTAAGWNYHLYEPHRTEILTSKEAFATDLLAAMAGIAHAEMLMSDPQWVAAHCEAQIEERASRKAEQENFDIKSAIRWARENGRDDLAADVKFRRLKPADVYWIINEQRRLNDSAIPADRAMTEHR
jgi:hypothetical protein